MPQNDETMTDDLRKEAIRLYEDCSYNSRGHFILSQFWRVANLWLNLPAILLSALTAALAFVEIGLVAGITAVLVLLITTAFLFLNPSERSERHKTAAERYLALRSEIRLYYEIRLKHAGDTKKALIDVLTDFSTRKNQLNIDSPDIPDWVYERTKRQIQQGRSDYHIDLTP